MFQTDTLFAYLHLLGCNCKFKVQMMKIVQMISSYLTCDVNHTMYNGKITVSRYLHGLFQKYNRNLS